MGDLMPKKTVVYNTDTETYSYRSAGRDFSVQPGGSVNSTSISGIHVKAGDPSDGDSLAFDAESASISWAPAGSDGVPEAPKDECLYARQGGEWVEAETKGAAETVRGNLITHSNLSGLVHGVGVGGFEDKGNKGEASGYCGLDSERLVPAANIATGTPNGTKYLRDDRTWQPVTGGSGLTHAQIMSRVFLGG
jgi:hypothetical protein